MVGTLVVACIGVKPRAAPAVHWLWTRVWKGCAPTRNRRWKTADPRPPEPSVAVETSRAAGLSEQKSELSGVRWAGAEAGAVADEFAPSDRGAAQSPPEADRDLSLIHI